MAPEERCGPRFPGLTREFVSHVADIRAQKRLSAGGGGCCHLVTEEISSIYGLGRAAVAYLDENLEVICACHYVSVLPDGTIFDPTSDQFGEGRDMSVISAEDPGRDRYRPEFREGHHPGAPGCGHLSRWEEAWKRMPVPDHVAESMLKSERGQGWWLEDATEMMRYLEEEASLTAPGAPASNAAKFSAWLADNLKRSHPSLSERFDPEP